MSLLYEVRGLVRRYGRVTALDLPALGVDELRIHSGQVLTLVGYNICACDAVRGKRISTTCCRLNVCWLASV